MINQKVNLLKSSNELISQEQIQSNFIDEKVDDYLVYINSLEENDSVKRLINKKLNCAIREIDLFSPLLENEIIEDEKLVFLDKDFEEFKKGEAFFIRKTNFVKVYYHYFNENIYNYDLSKLNSDNFQKKVNSTFIEPISLSALLISAAIALAKAAGSALVYKAYKEVFPDKLPELNDKILKQISDILEKKINDDHCTLVKNKAQAINHWFLTTYSNKKEELLRKNNLTDEDKCILKDMLNIRRDKLSEDLIPELNFCPENRYQESQNFTIFLLAVNQQLFIMLEIIALGDLSMLKNYQADVEMYSNMVRSSLGFLIEKRKKLAKIEHTQHTTYSPVSREAYTHYYLNVYDPINGYKGPVRTDANKSKNDDGTGREKVQNEYNDYILHMPERTNNELNDPLAVVNAWEESLKKLPEYKIQPI